MPALNVISASVVWQLMPALSVLALAALLGSVAIGIFVARALLGSANPVARHRGLWVLRGGILALTLLVLLNPVSILELPGPVERPELFYLLDASSSMAIGSPTS